MDLGLLPDFMPHRPEFDPDNGVEAFKLSVADVEVLQIQILVSQLGLLCHSD